MEATIITALSQILDPDLEQDIVSAGYVKDLRVENNSVSLTLDLPVHISPTVADLPTRVETAIMELDGIESVTATVSGAQPNRAVSGGQPSGLAKVKTILAVSSCKGGVGKSTVAAALASELASRGHSIGLLDTDIYGPSVPTLFNLHEEGVAGNEQQFMLPVEVNGLKVFSFGFLTGRKPAVMRGPIVSNYLQQGLHRVAWDELDVLVIDMPPGTGDIQLTMTQSIQIDGAVIVTTPQALSLADVEKGILMFDKVNVPVLGVVENMAWYTCDSCDKRHFPFGSDTSTLTDRFGLATLAQLPIDQTSYGKTFDDYTSSSDIAAATDAVLAHARKARSVAGKAPRVEFDSSSITLQWSDGQTMTVANADLRKACRCARCINEMSGEPILDPATIPDDIQAKDVRTIGNYAILVEWSDGHDSGLFPYPAIQDLMTIVGARS